MKKIIVALLALIMCLGCFTACDLLGSGDPSGTPEGEATIVEAVQYLRGIYKDSAKETPADYDVVGKVVIGKTTFTVTWTTDNESIVIKASDKTGFYTVDLPAKNDTPVDYKLTATITDGNGVSEKLEFERTLPVYDSSAIVARPEEGTAYKFYLVHAALGQTLFANGETDNDKYLKTTTDPKAALDFFVEADGEGFKFYTTIGGTKMYVKASLVALEDGKVSKYLGYSATEGTTWIYKSDVNGWFTTIDGIEYVVGTYGTYNTFCISEGTYLSVENTGKTQFPGGLMLKETAEAMTPSEGPTVYETPEEIVNAAYELALGGVLSAGHKYTLTGVITDIPSAYSADYGNITVVIVVGDMTDKPIECFRLKGEGIENLMVGDTITVTGEILKYDNKSETGKVEFNAGCTLDSGNFCKHTEEVIPGKDATCTEAGLTEGKKCTTCEKTLVEQTEIEALGHDWATVMSSDESGHWTACSRCDEVKDKANHNNGSDSICDDCGYGCAHTDVNPATCGAESTCKACGTVLAPATGEHTYDDDSDATCNVCGFEREILTTVVIYFPKDGKYVTGIEYLYAARNKLQLTLSENKADAVPLQVITNSDGTVSFMADGKYLYADNTNIEFVDAAGENTLFVREEADGGIFIRCNTANYSGKPQYLEVYSGYLTVYGMGTDASIYTFVLESAEGASGKVVEVQSGDSGSGDDQPSAGATSVPGGVSSVAADTDYKLAGVNANGTLYFDGTEKSGRINGTETGITVKLEAAAAAGEYYIYFMDGSSKVYIGIAGDDDSSDFKFFTEKTDDCVWTVDATTKTIVSKVNPKRGMATQNTSTYTNFSTYSVSNFGTDPIYVPCWFVAA